MKCEICFGRAKTVSTRHKKIGDRVVCFRRVQCLAGCMKGDRPYRFTSREAGRAICGGDSRKTTAEAQISPSPNGGMCITITVLPGGSP